MSYREERIFDQTVSGNKSVNNGVGKKFRGDVGGYEVTLCEKSGTEKFLCLLCGYLLKDPIQTTRGHLACASCYEIGKNGSETCPLDGEPIEAEHTFFDKAKKQEISALLCYCKHRSEGCDWIGEVCIVQEHEETCTFRPHRCHFCGTSVVCTEVEQHLSVCDRWLKDKQCPYFGCPNKVESMDELKEHLQCNILSHAIKSTSQVIELKNHIHKLEEEQVLQATRTDQIIENLSQQMSDLLKHSQQMEESYNSRTQQLQNRIQQLEQEHEQHLQNNHPQQQIVSTESALTVTQVQQHVREFKSTLNDLSLRQQLLENSSFDGNLMWKINKVTERMNKAVSGSVTALHSAPIFTSQYGYKFCGRLYLNGDGLGRETHVSLFVVLMRGEFDQLLEWPFSKVITFRLVNQSGGDDLVESFLADPKSSSFHKPTTEMNVASGVPMFIEKKKLFSDGFVKEDNLFVKISIA